MSERVFHLNPAPKFFFLAQIFVKDQAGIFALGYEHPELRLEPRRKLDQLLMWE